MYKYLVSSSASAYSLIFYDQQGAAGYSLSLKMAPAQLPTGVNALANASVNPFAGGQALMLVLQRRDLARAIVTITATTFSYTLCNSVTHSYKAEQNRSKGRISVSEGAAGNSSNCAKANDLTYIKALNSAASFSYDASANTIVFTDKDGLDVVTFSRT